MSCFQPIRYAEGKPPSKYCFNEAELSVANHHDNVESWWAAATAESDGTHSSNTSRISNPVK